MAGMLEPEFRLPDVPDERRQSRKLRAILKPYGLIK